VASRSRATWTRRSAGWSGSDRVTAVDTVYHSSVDTVNKAVVGEVGNTPRAPETKRSFNFSRLFVSPLIMGAIWCENSVRLPHHPWDPVRAPIVRTSRSS
jgi:hypothetical protein